MLRCNTTLRWLYHDLFCAVFSRCKPSTGTGTGATFFTQENQVAEGTAGPPKFASHGKCDKRRIGRFCSSMNLPVFTLFILLTLSDQNQIKIHFRNLGHASAKQSTSSKQRKYETLKTLAFIIAIVGRRMGDNISSNSRHSSDILNRYWVNFCGAPLGANNDSPTKVFYWEFFSDAALVTAPAAMAPLFLQQRGFFDFTLIYFSLVNGWLLYVHHFKARFQEQSRVHVVLQWIFILSLFGGVWSCSHFLVRPNDLTEEELTTMYQQFSLFMGLLRFSVIVMFARVAVYVWRAASLCILVVFFLGNSFLCFTLATISDRKSILILWGIGAIVESLMDFFLALCLGRWSHVPIAMSFTIDRFWAVILAPLGSVSVVTFLQSMSNSPAGGGEQHTDPAAFRVSAVLLMALFGVLFYNLKHAISDRLNSCHFFLQTLGLLHMKLLGLALWTVGANLCILVKLLGVLDTSPKDDVQHHMDLLALSVLFALVLFFAWKSCNGHPYELGEVVWILLINGAFISGTILSRKSSHLGLVTLDIVFVAVLSLIESSSCLQLCSQQLFHHDDDGADSTTTTTTTTVYSQLTGRHHRSHWHTTIDLTSEHDHLIPQIPNNNNMEAASVSHPYSSLSTGIEP